MAEAQADPVFIAMWTHKGGEKKTTSSLSLAYALAHRGKNVLVVDGDEQCDATHLCYGNKIDDDYDGVTMKFVNRTRPVLDENNQVVGEEPVVRSLFGAVHPLIYSGGVGRLSPIEPEPLLRAGPQHGRIDVVLGNRRTGSLNTKIAQAYAQWQSLPILRNYPGAPFRAIEACARKVNADFVIIDLAPNAGPLNASLLMQSNFWISPTGFMSLSCEALASQTDRVAYRAEDLEGGIPAAFTLADDDMSWTELAKQWVQRTKGVPNLLYPVRDKLPKFLGVIISGFTSVNSQIKNPGLLGDRSTDGVVIAQGVAVDLPSNNVKGWMNKVWDTTYSIVTRTLTEVTIRLHPNMPEERYSLVLPYKKYKELNITPLLGRIKEWGQLGAIGQRVNKPVAFLEQSDIGTYNPVMDAAVKVDQRPVSDKDSRWKHVCVHRKIWDQIAWNVLALIHKAGHPAVPNMPTDRKREQPPLGGPPDPRENFLILPGDELPTQSVTSPPHRAKRHRTLQPPPPPASG